VGRLYIVAKPDALKQAIAPFTTRARIKTPTASADLAKAIQDMLPQATVAAGEGEIVVNGIPDDVKLAEELIGEHVTEADRTARHAEVVSLGVVSIKQVTEVISDLFPHVKVTVLSEGTAGGGTIALIGPEADVAAAKGKSAELDEATPNRTSTMEVASYDLRYASARTCTDFLKEAAPEVQVTIAPPTQIPDRLTAALGATSTSAGGTAPSGGGGGAAGGGAAGGGSGGGGTAPNPQGGGGTIGGTGAPTGFNASDKATRLVIKGRKADVNTALDLLKSVDQKPQQVVIDVRIVDISPELIQHTGINYTWQPFQFFDTSAGTSVANAASNTRPIPLGVFSRTPLDLTATLDALVEHADAKLLASPSMQVLNNEEADFFVGSQLSYPITTTSSFGAQSTIVQTYNVGIGLNVRPHLNADGNIMMRINPVVQSLTAITNGLPQTASREANTIVMVKDGQSVVIGGLIEDQDQKTINEVPLLGQIPILGQLFRHTERDHLKSNIVVSVTPHIVKDPEAKK
jgi:type II secretory pathway component GspD/PulD (secretin)